MSIFKRNFTTDPDSVAADHHADLVSKVIIVAMTVAALGPYIYGSVRTEQLTVYVLGCGLLPLSLRRLPSWSAVVLATSWLFLLGVALLGLIDPPSTIGPWESGDPLAGIDNLLLPLVVMLLVWSRVDSFHASSLIRLMSSILVWSAAVNGFLAVLSFRIDLGPFLRHFWAGSSGETVADRAASMGRYSGIFNQPAEAGVFYGLAGLLAIYRFRDHPIKLTVSLTLIGLGGLMCVSKIFLLGAIPLIAWYAWRGHARRSLLPFVLTTALIIVAPRSGEFEQWLWIDRLQYVLLPPEDRGLLEVYTADRWNSGAGLRQVISIVLGVSPIGGVGAAGWAVAYDSGWTEAILVAGLIGAVCQAIVFAALLWMAHRTSDPGLRLLALLAVTFLLGANFGISSLTSNRNATIVWVFLSLVVLAQSQPRSRGVPGSERRLPLRQTGTLMKWPSVQRI